MLTQKIVGDTLLFYRDDKVILSVEETERDGGILMKLRGELVSECALPLQDELASLIASEVQVAVDFSEVEYVSAASINALLDSQYLADDLRRGGLILVGVPDQVYQQLDKYGLTELLMIED